MANTGPAAAGSDPTPIRHEVREGMGVILGFAELLLDDERLSARHRRFSAHIHDAAGRLFARLMSALPSDDRPPADERR